jgi:hypothetical protein
MKNVDLNTESHIENGASMYSMPWSPENARPSVIVAAINAVLPFRLFFRIKWWAHVTVTPDDTNSTVFNRGILIGLNVLIETGGQDAPISCVGEILLCR